MDELDGLYPEHLRTLMRRTDASLAATGFDALVIHAGRPPLLFLDDQDYPYKVDPHFKAWVPVLDNPKSVLVYAPGRRPRVLFHQPDDFWHQAARLPQAAWTGAVDWVPMANPEAAVDCWRGLGQVAFIGAQGIWGAAEAASINDPGLLTRLHYDRAVKTDYELECMRRANALAARGHRAALAAFRAGASEYQAHMRYLEACSLREEELPYNNIVAYDTHAAVLHYQHLDRQAPTPPHSFLIDAGAPYRGYAADVTRTYAAKAGRFAELIEAVDRAQQRLCAEIVTGCDYRDVHLSAHRLLGDVLFEAGLTTLRGADALASGVTGVFFPHGIGHLLGLQVHDVGGVLADLGGTERERPLGHPHLRLTRMLEPGVVVTVEPGLYFIESLLSAAQADTRRQLIDWSVVDELRPYGGIRIEDNVITTATGPENMTRDAFARLEEAARAA